MHRQSKNINAPLEVKENESRCTEEKEEASFLDQSKDQKICTVTKSKVIKASKEENLSDGNQARLQKRTLKYFRGLKKESRHNQEDVVSCQFTERFIDVLKGDVVGEPALPLNGGESFSRSRPVALGDECYLTPNRAKAEEASDCAMSEKQRKEPVDFASATIAEFGITQESFTKRSIGKSPTTLKFRRRSTIGVRGSPENNTLIRYLAQQKSDRQKAFTEQVSPFKRENVRSLKDKIDAFQASFKSVQEGEGESSFSGLSRVDDASQESGSSQNKVPFTKERNLDQWSEKFRSDDSGGYLKENLRQNVIKSSKSDTKTCTILSSCQAVTVTEPAAAVSKEWVYEQHNPVESLEAVLIRDIIETGRDFSSDHITKDIRRSVLSGQSRKGVGFVEELSLDIFDENKPPVTPPITPLQSENSSLTERTQSGSGLRSVLKKTPVKQFSDSLKEHSDDAVDRGGGESLTVANCAKTFEATETDGTERPKKKRVTFGEVLSPEIFDETLPANTPLRKGATPAPSPGLLHSNSSLSRSSLIAEPLSQPDFDCDDECVEPPEEFVEGPVAAEDPLPAENADETDKSGMITTSTKKEQCSTISEETDFSTSRATNTKNAKESKNPRKNRFQRQKNVTTSAAKKTQKTKHTSYGKRRKKKVKKSLYGEREMASKKPLLSPIPEIPETFSSASSSNSPDTQALFSEDILFLDDARSGKARRDVEEKAVAEGVRGATVCAAYSSSEDLDLVEASGSGSEVFHVSSGDPQSSSGIDHEFSNSVPDAKCGFDTSDYFQQGKETACVKEAKESGSLIENNKLQGNLLNKAEQLSGLEFLEQRDTSVHESAQGTQCPQKDSISSPPRRRSRKSSAVCFPPVETLEITGNDLPVSSFNVEEVLSVPQRKTNSFEPFRRRSSNSGERRVRRSMRLNKDAEMEGLAWIQVPDEIQNPPLIASACKIRRSSTSILTQSENIHHRKQNLIPFSAPGKENHDSVNLADGPCKRWRRRSMCVSTPQETRTWSQTRRSITNSVYWKDRSKKKHFEEVEIPLENNSFSEVSATSDFLK
ncbi:cell division cycle-associated protein 2 isoform X4 [Athene cunicularia]|uniref:cell division cycle-associated protein 2 isoform X4 n=1 Tax=Athene cunicularia TaxID=194338 RepID=UPI000EF6F4D3|nr:cell division cycle-associated protein 2 isoform X4 [Athene cunicularia]